MELKHLHGLESSSRLSLFFEQVESCSWIDSERIEVAKMRVGVDLAMRIQALITEEYIQTWPELKECLRGEFCTEINFDRAWQHLEMMSYDWMDSPQAFVNEFRCQYSLLQSKFGRDELPNRNKLLKKKLIRGMPADTQERLSSFTDAAIPMNKFLDRVEAERSLRLHQLKSNVKSIKGEDNQQEQMEDTSKKENNRNKNDKNNA